MANVVSKLVDEIKWGAMFGVMQSDMYVQKFNEKGGYVAPRWSHQCDVNISLDIEADVTKEGISNILGVSSIFDVKVTDLHGNEVIIPNAKISERLRVTRRIQRKLKKTLKKKHGAYWLQHHPNTETIVTINSQN